MKKGFTLIEMLIVIAIIAILSSVFLVGVRNIRQGAYDSRRLSDLRNMQAYLETYYNASNRSYPAAGSNWTNLVSILEGGNFGITKVPQDPLVSSGHDNYVYCVASDSQGYILGAHFDVANNSSLSESYRGDTSGYTCTSANINCGVGSPWYCVKF